MCFGGIVVFSLKEDVKAKQRVIGLDFILLRILPYTISLEEIKKTR